MSTLEEQAQLEKLEELLRARIPAKWWWCDFTVTVKNYNLSGKKAEEGLFEAIQTTIEIARKAGEEKTSKKIQLYNILYSNINEILEKVNQLQYMEKIMQKLEDAKKDADKNQKKELANLQLDLVDEFRRNNGIITATENEIANKIAQIAPQPTENQVAKAKNSIPASEEAEVPPLDMEVAKLAEEVKKIDYHTIPILQGIQTQINETLKKLNGIQTRETTKEEREEVVSQLKFWANGKTYFAQLANIALEALEPGYAPIAEIPIEYVRTFIEYQNQIPLKLDLTNQMIIVAPEKKKQIKN